MNESLLSIPGPAVPARDPSSAPARRSVDLSLEGMTCAACAARIEKTLNRVPGAKAGVNLATETASVRFDPALATVGALLAGAPRAGPRRTPRGDTTAGP